MSFWAELLQTLIISDSQEKDTRTDEQLSSFESSNKIILPGEYKDFCKLFGSGTFGHFIRIYCPELDQIDVEFLKENLQDSEGVEGSEFGFMIRDGGTLSDVGLIEEILDSAFIFGYTSGGELFFWDLRTYSEIDNNYDIYISRTKDFPGIYKVGRSFIEFIQIFALGTKSHDHLPDWTYPSLQELNGIFTPTKVPEIRSWNYDELVQSNLWRLYDDSEG